jgi:phage tail-like protein
MTEFVPFRFKVTLFAEDRAQIVCGGYFSEVMGLEVTMEPKAIAEGGRNWGTIQRSGQATFSPAILKRGVTTVNDLWSWFDTTTRGANYGYRLQGEIEVLGNPSANVSESGNLISVTPNPIMTWKLERVLPIRFKGPDLAATANQIAIEELHLVYENLELVRPA